MNRASMTYYLVTTTRDPEATGTISVRADGPNANETYLDSNGHKTQAEKIIGIAVGCGIGGMLIVATCFTLCLLRILRNLNN